MASILLIAGGAIGLVLLILLWRYSYWYRRGVPQGNPLMLFGDMNDVMLSPIPFWDLHRNLGRRFADKAFFGGYSLTSPRLFVRDPNMVKAILTSKFSSFSENGFAISEDLEPIIGRDPFFQKGGDKWKESRAHFSSLMTPSRLRVSMLPEIAVVSGQAIQYLKEQQHESGRGDGVNVKDFGVRYMTDILVRVSLSLEAGSFKDGENPFMHQATHLFREGFMAFLMTIFVFFAPKLGKILGVSFLTKEVTDFFDHLVQKQKQDRSANGIKRDDILELIVKKSAEMKKSKADADMEVLALIIMFFMEGFETSSTVIAAALVSLAAHEDIQEDLRREVLKACPIGKEVTEEAINSITLLQNCVTETLRLYPPGMILQRVVTEDVTLEGRHGEELSLKKGQTLMVPLAALHYDPESFPDPEKFDPNRFEDEAQKRLHLGFGDGPRQCPGQKFATLSIKVILATILREFKLELGPGTKFPVRPINNAFLFAVKDVRVRFVPL